MDGSCHIGVRRAAGTEYYYSQLTSRDQLPTKVCIPGLAQLGEAEAPGKSACTYSASICVSVVAWA
jgi:hypothetical protein